MLHNHCALFWWNQKKSLPRFHIRPQTEPNICWVSRPSGELGLKPDELKRTTPSLHQNIHPGTEDIMQTSKAKQFTDMLSWYWTHASVSNMDSYPWKSHAGCLILLTHGQPLTVGHGRRQRQEDENNDFFLSAECLQLIESSSKTQLLLKYALLFSLSCWIPPLCYAFLLDSPYACCTPLSPSLNNLTSGQKICQSNIKHFAIGP